jgi:MFS family permease
VQGIVLVTFPAAGSILTEPQGYDLSATQYGALFLPQVITAIAASLLSGGAARRFGTKRVYLAGLLANLVAMLLLILSSFFAGDASVYSLLLVSTAFLGVGFGLTVPAVNTFTAAFNPTRIDRSVLVLNALLGLGTALAPVFVAVFVGLGFWWGLPVVSSILLLALLGASARLPLLTGAAGASDDHSTGGAPASHEIPSRFWVFALVAVLYGICETLNGNWSQTVMARLGASTTMASIALTTFWAMVTVGRIVFASIQQRLPTRRTYGLLPFVLAGAFILIAALPKHAPWLGVAAFGLAGLGCSALLPLTISFGQDQLVAISASVPGGVIAFYQLGYGIAAFGAGPLQAAGVKLSVLYAGAAGVALVMGALSFVLTPGRREAASA